MPKLNFRAPVNTLSVYLTTTSPWHIAYPDNLVKERNGEGKEVQYSATLKKKIGRQNIPYYAGNGVRNGMRRMARDFLMRFITEINGPITTDFFNGLSCGASRGKPDSSKNSVEELTRASQHCYMGLFGGGARLLSGKIRVSDINIICQDTLNKGIIKAGGQKRLDIESSYPEVFGEKPVQPFMFTDKRHFVRIDDVVRGLSPDHIKAIDGGMKAVDEHIEAVSSGDAKRKADSAVKKDSLANIITYEVIPEGTPMHFSISMDPDITEGQLGLLLISLQMLLQRNYFGGRGSNGLGEARIDSLSLVSDNHDVEISKPSEALYNDNGDFELPSEFYPLMEIAAAEAESLDPVETESYFLSMDQIKKQG